MKVTIKGHLFLYSPKWSPKPLYVFNEHELAGANGDFVKICDHSFDVEIPDDFDPAPKQIAALNEAKRLLRLKLAGELADLDERISKLSALTFEAAT